MYHSKQVPRKQLCSYGQGFSMISSASGKKKNSTFIFDKYVLN